MPLVQSNPAPKFMQAFIGRLLLTNTTDIGVKTTDTVDGGGVAVLTVMVAAMTASGSPPSVNSVSSWWEGMPCRAAAQ